MNNCSARAAVTWPTLTRRPAGGCGPHSNGTCRRSCGRRGRWGTRASARRRSGNVAGARWRSGRGGGTGELASRWRSASPTADRNLEQIFARNRAYVRWDGSGASAWYTGGEKTPTPVPCWSHGTGHESRSAPGLGSACQGVALAASRARQLNASVTLGGYNSISSTGVRTQLSTQLSSELGPLVGARRGGVMPRSKRPRRWPDLEWLWRAVLIVRWMVELFRWFHDGR